MVHSSHPYRRFPGPVTSRPPSDPLRESSRTARAFVLGVAAVRLGLALGSGWNTDACLAAWIVCIAALSLAVGNG
jgi:hypothetical protein